jgi:hypothetical protein
MAIKLEISLAKGETAPSALELLARTLASMVEVGERFTIGELRRAAQVHYLGAGRSFIRFLLAEGVIEGQARSGRYLLVKPVPELPPKGAQPLADQGQQQVWNVLRGSSGRNGIGRSELRLLASTQSLKLDDSIENYLSALVRAGVLREDERGLRLLPAHNTGPLAPRLYEALVPVDPNRRAVCVSIVQADEVAP